VTLSVGPGAWIRFEHKTTILSSSDVNLDYSRTRLQGKKILEELVALALPSISAGLQEVSRREFSAMLPAS
jgi:hypothetical protein